jgi:hypothetical protein
MPLHRDGHAGNRSTWRKLVEITDAETIVQQHDDKAAWLWFSGYIDSDRIALANARRHHVVRSFPDAKVLRCCRHGDLLAVFVKLTLIASAVASTNMSVVSLTTLQQSCVLGLCRLDRPIGSANVGIHMSPGGSALSKQRHGLPLDEDRALLARREPMMPGRGSRPIGKLRPPAINPTRTEPLEQHGQVLLSRRLIRPHARLLSASARSGAAALRNSMRE